MALFIESENAVTGLCEQLGGFMIERAVERLEHNRPWPILRQEYLGSSEHLTLVAFDVDFE